MAFKNEQEAKQYWRENVRLMLVLLVSGFIFAFTLQREMFPESRPDKLLISAIYPGVQPEDVEKAVTVKVEEAVRSLEGIEKVESQIGEGISFVTLTIAQSVSNVDALMQEVRNELDAIQDLPDDEILCEVLQLIKASDKPRNLSHWVSKAAQIRDLPHRVAGQLAEKGIVTADEKKVLWVFSRRIYPELDGTFEDEIRQRMAALMFGNAAADARTTVLVALARHAGLLKENFAPAELEQHQERIANLASGNILAEGATQETIKAIQTAIIVAAIVPSTVASTVATGR